MDGFLTPFRFHTVQLTSNHPQANVAGVANSFWRIVGETPPISPDPPHAKGGV